MLSEADKREIARHVRAARFPYKQIGIEAQLRAVPESAILDAIGVKNKKDVPVYHPKAPPPPEMLKRKRQKHPAQNRKPPAKHRRAANIRPDQKERVVELYFKGNLTQAEVGKIVGISQEAVSKIVRPYKSKGWTRNA